MMKFYYQYPVYDRNSGENVFDWILMKSEAARRERKLVREFEYRNLIAKREADGKPSEETSQEAGKAKARKAGGAARPAKASA